ncbi:MAG: PQQ-dependent sugar dehydrogenase, partial [Pseudomonadota bacterium]
MRPSLIVPAVLALVFGTGACAQGFQYGPRNSDFPPAFPEQTRAPLVDSGVNLTVRPLAEGLERPWGIATLPDGAGWLVTERPGRLRHIASDGTMSAPIAGIPRVLAARQGGLLDVVVAPDFAESRVIYVTYAKPVSGG